MSFYTKQVKALEKERDELISRYPNLLHLQNDINELLSKLPPDSKLRAMVLNKLMLETIESELVPNFNKLIIELNKLKDINRP